MDLGTLRVAVQHHAWNTANPTIFWYSKMVSPIFEKLSESLTNIDFYKVDVDEQEVSLSPILD